MRTLAAILFTVASMSGWAAQAQTLELTAEADKSDILTGESLVYTFKYKCASTTNNCTGVTLTATIPQNIIFPTQTIGLPSDIQSYSISPSGNSITFTFKEPLTAGNTGIIQVTGQGSFGIADNSTSTLTAVLSSNGVPGSTQTVNTTIHAYDKFCPSKSNGVGLGIDNTTTYTIRLSGASQNGYQLTGVGLLSPGPVTVVDQLPAGTVIESVNVIPVDGLPVPTIPTGVCVVDNANARITCTFPASVMEVKSQFQPVVDIKINVKYPSTAFTAGTNVTNSVTVTYQPVGTSTPITLVNGDVRNFTDGATYTTTATRVCTAKLDVTDPLVASLSKLSYTKTGTSSAKPGEDLYFDLNISNTGNTTLTDIVIEDIIPEGLTITRFAPGEFVGLVGGEVATHYVKTANNPTYTALTTFPYTVAAGDKITAYKMLLNQLPPGAYNRYMRLSGTSSPGVSGTSIVNCYTATAGNAGLVTDPATQACHTITITQLDPFSTLSIYKVFVQSPSVPSSVFYTPVNTATSPFWAYISATNSGGGQPLENAVIMDLLPIGLDFTGQILYQSPTPPASTTEAIPNFNGTGRTLIRLTWNTPMPAGTTYGFNIGVKVNPLAPAGLVSDYSSNDRLYNPYLQINGLKNTAFFTGTSPKVCRVEQYFSLNQFQTNDLYDLNSNTQTTSESLCYSSTHIGVTTAAQLSSVKWVKGQCDTEYSRYPDFGQTVPGGIANYKLIVTNTGNVASTSVEILDILPWVGDQGVIDPTARLTEWRPNLVTPIQTPAGVTVYYSTATNPCRTDYVAAGPAGCTPADPTTIQSLKLDFGTKVLQPGDQIELSWDMRAPVTAPTNNEIAWNSFGFKAKRQDNNDPFLPSEPFKVGIKVKADVNSSYGNFVWLDANKNGIQDAGETGIDGVRVELHKDNGDNVNDPKTDPLIAFTSTANGGLYLFPGLAPGNYYAVFFLPPGYETSPANATSDDKDSDGIAGICNGSRVTIAPITSLSATENDLTWDQGIFPAKAAVGNYVWFDENQNNIQDESSANGINGVIVCLYTSTGVFSASTVTTNDVYGRPGYYLFDQLEAGSYYVQFKPTPDKTYTPGSGSQGGSTSDETDSDVDPATGRTATFTLAPGEINLTWDAGLIIQTGPYKLGNYVWSDTNNNGLVDKDEVGLNGVTVNLYNDRNNDNKPQADEQVTTTITGTVAGIDGVYTFDRLPAGNYIVQIPDVNFKGVLLDYVSSTGNDPAPDPDNNVENDDNGSAVVDCGIISKPITLSAVAEPLDGGYTNYSVDFGFYKCIKPDYAASVVQPTCAGGLGSISIGGGTIGDKVGYSIGTTFTGSYSTAVAISSLTNGVVVGNINGSSTDVTYTVRVFNGEEVCYNDFTFTIAKLECCVTPTNVAATALPANVAPGATVTLNATATGTTSGTTTYTWSGPGISSPTATTISSRTVAAPATTGLYTYTVLVSNGAGCEATATVSLTVEIPCALTTTATPGTCDPATNRYTVSGTISLTSATAGTATITDGAVSTTVSVPAGATSVAYSLTGLTSGTGSHTVTVSLPGCGTASATYTAPVSCTVAATIDVTSATVCYGNSATLTASGCTGTVTWSNGTSGTTLVTPALTQTTSYTATCTTATSSTFAVGTVTVLPQPVLNLSASSTLVTVGSNVTLTAAGCAGTITWSNGSTGTSIVVTPTQPSQTYSATCTTGPACFTTASIVLNTIPPCSVSLVVTAGTCQSATNTFSATATLTANNLLQPQSVTLTLGGQSQVFSLTASGENTVQMTVDGLPANGTTGTATALFAGTACGSASATFAAPASCSAAPSVTLEKRVSALEVRLGDVVSYTLTLTNTSPVSATNLVVTDTFSASIAFVPGSATASAGNFTQNPTGGTWSVATLPAGTTATLVFSVSLVTEGITINTATLPTSDTVIETKVCTTVPYLVCKGQPFAIRLTVPSGYSRYQWYLTAPGATTSTLVADGSLNSFTATLPGTYGVVADGGALGNCTSQSCCQIVIQETEVPLFTLVTQKPTCVGATPQADGQLQITGLPTTGRYQYQYSPTTSFDAATAQPAQAAAIPANGFIASNLTEGNYTVRVTDTQTGCFRDVTVGLSANCACPTNKCVPITVSKIQK
ncbi:SdrD B-like domain-containing protein [Rudanella lutea]|uniref:SdrD B-like domain-containing protein n=1 Tax=Rudanella lutea TaxID=451374 RepID=UPI000377F09F|nr:SdrD B-like domain-containing protein [Rudanella lutea]